MWRNLKEVIIDTAQKVYVGVKSQTRTRQHITNEGNMLGNWRQSPEKSLEKLKKRGKTKMEEDSCYVDDAQERKEIKTISRLLKR